MMAKAKKKVAILIPTRNRSDFIVEILRYYIKVGCQHTIYIGDASDSQHVELLTPVIRSLRDDLDIVYRQFPDYCRGAIDNGVTIKNLLEFVEEEYVAWSGDDDFYIPRSLDTCVDFLEASQEFSSIHGYGRYIKYDKARATSVIGGRYIINEYNGSSGVERLNSLMNNFSVLFFGVHRTENFLKIYRNMELLTKPLLVELMPLGLCTILGKSKKINEFQIVRGIHEERSFQPNLIGQILDSDWSPSFEVYLSTLTEELGRVDCISNNDAREIVKQGFLDYIERYLRSRYCMKEEKTLKKMAKQIIRGLKRIIPVPVRTSIRNSIIPRGQENKLFTESYCSIPELSKSSPYYYEYVALLSAWNGIYGNLKPRHGIQLE